MTKIEKVKRGLEIILQYENDGAIGCDSDAIYAGDKPDLYGEHLAEMKQLKWFWDEKLQCWGIFV